MLQSVHLAGPLVADLRCYRAFSWKRYTEHQLHTPCRIAVDLRKPKAQALLQSISFPPAPMPTVTIADILQLKELQRFDLMAIASKILEERKGC